MTEQTRSNRQWIRRVLFIALGVAFFLTSHCAFADSWGAPTLEHWSTNRRFVLRVDEKTAMLALMQSPDKGTAKSKRAGETVVWRVPSPLKGVFRIPVAAYIRDDGRAVVLRDQYGGVGEGTVLAFLDAQGKTLQTYTLDDLFSESEILSMPHTISSIWWSSGLFRFTDTQDGFGFITYQEAIGVFDLATGKRLTEDSPETKKFCAQALRIAHDDLSGKVGSEPERGAMLSRVLKDQDCVPVLTRLLTDTTHHHTIMSGKREEEYFDLQIEAGTALVTLLGVKAAPLLEARLTKANVKMTESWISLIAKAGMATRSNAVLKCADSQNRDVRYTAVNAIVDNLGVAIVRRHPEWLQADDANLRYLVIRCLAENGDFRDLPELRHALTDRDDTVRLWGVRGLARLKPTDFTTVLKRYIKKYPNETEPHILLADEGDAQQLRWCVNAVSHFVDGWRHDHRTTYVRYSKMIIGDFDLKAIVRVLVHHRPAGTEILLKKITTLPGDIYCSVESFECTGFGGLASLGDMAALARVRSLAKTRDPFVAADAIEWLGMCRDHASAPFLISLGTNREKMIRDAARTTLNILTLPEAK